MLPEMQSLSDMFEADELAAAIALSLERPGRYPGAFSPVDGIRSSEAKFAAAFASSATVESNVAWCRC